MTENLEPKKKLNLDDPDDIDWLYNWAQQAQRELEYLREKVSPFEAPVSPKTADIPATITFEVKDIVELLTMVDMALQPDFPINKSQPLLQKIKIICLKYGINWTGRG